MLHGIGPAPTHTEEVEKPYWVSRESFATVLDLARSLPLRLTFDDANSTDISIALPALQAAGLKASFFIPTDRIGQKGYVDEEDIRTLHAAGMEIGSHGCAHVRWTTLNNADIACDVARSIERLSAIINAPVRSVAIPFGSCDRRVLSVLRALGVGRVYSSFRGQNDDEAWLVRRECIMAGMSCEDIHNRITYHPTIAESALNFLKVWRRAGNAALWAA